MNGAGMKKISDHFDGRRYYNPAIKTRSLWEVIQWRWKRHVKRWPFVPVEQQKVKKIRSAQDECLVTFINHSTVLLQLSGWNILTDPIWSERASPFSWLGPKRVILPGIKFEDLPPIDLVLLSHNHYDHMDIPTLRKLFQEHRPTFFVPKGNRSYLQSKGIRSPIHELDWWECSEITSDFSLHFVPAQHFSSRGIFDLNATLWGGFVIKGNDRMIYYAGDSGYCNHFAEIQKRLGSPTLSILPIGAFEPRWFMQTVHLSPEEAVRVHLILNSKQSLAVHFGTFQLADEDLNQPLQELHKSLIEHDLPIERFWVLKPGESREVYKQLA